MAQTFGQHGHPWGIEPERIPVHSPNDNASMESWHAPRERECLNRQEFATYQDAYRGVTRRIEEYHTIRIPSGLPYGSKVSQYLSGCGSVSFRKRCDIRRPSRTRKFSRNPL